MKPMPDKIWKSWSPNSQREHHPQISILGTLFNTVVFVQAYLAARGHHEPWNDRWTSVCHLTPGFSCAAVVNRRTLHIPNIGLQRSVHRFSLSVSFWIELTTKLWTSVSFPIMWYISVQFSKGCPRLPQHVIAIRATIDAIFPVSLKCDDWLTPMRTNDLLDSITAKQEQWLLQGLQCYPCNLSIWTFRLTLCSGSALLLSYLFCVLWAPVKSGVLFKTSKFHLRFNMLPNWVCLLFFSHVLEANWLQ